MMIPKGLNPRMMTEMAGAGGKVVATLDKMLEGLMAIADQLETINNKIDALNTKVDKINDTAGIGIYVPKELEISEV